MVNRCCGDRSAQLPRSVMLALTAHFRRIDPGDDSPGGSAGIAIAMLSNLNIASLLVIFDTVIYGRLRIFPIKLPWVLPTILVLFGFVTLLERYGKTYDRITDVPVATVNSGRRAFAVWVFITLFLLGTAATVVYASSH
jgi:hypothetical protein